MFLHALLAIINSTIFTAKQPPHVTRTYVESVQEQSSNEAVNEQ